MKSTKKQLGWSSRLVLTLKISGITVGALFILSIVSLFIAPQPFYTQGFTTLADVQRYAVSTNELTPLESENAVKPDFTNYYKRFSPSIIKTIKEKFGGLLEKMHIKKPPVFTASFFKTILEDVNKTREQKGFKNTNIVKITATQQSKFIVFGDMQAAFHSLTRNLAKLKDLGILGEDLKIIPPDCYLIFLGNVPSRSPFSMEIEGLVLRLMQQNPDRVLYTKGSHESDGYWQEHTLKTELKIRAAGLTKEATPLESEVTKFFDSLPSIIYLAAPAPDGNAFVRFSRLTRSKWPDKNFAKFLITPSKDPVAILALEGNKLPEPEASLSEVNVKAILRVEKKRETYQPSEGLRTLAPEMGVTTWTLLSAPTLAVERGFKFYNDTFAIIEAAAQIEQWKITLFYQDRRKKDGYKTIPYFLTSGRDTPAPTQAITQMPAPGAPVTAIPVAAAMPVASKPAVPVQSTVSQPVSIPAVSAQPAITQPIAAAPIAPQGGASAQPAVTPALIDKPAVLAGQPQLEQKPLAAVSAQQPSAPASANQVAAPAVNPEAVQQPAMSASGVQASVTTSVVPPIVLTPAQSPAAIPTPAPATNQPVAGPIQPVQASAVSQVKQPTTALTLKLGEKSVSAAPVK